MCGIVGIYHRDGAPVDVEALVRMNDAIAHRGPDGEGFILLDPTGVRDPQFHSCSCALFWIILIKHQNL